MRRVSQSIAMKSATTVYTSMAPGPTKPPLIILDWFHKKALKDV